MLTFQNLSIKSEDTLERLTNLLPVAKRPFYSLGYVVKRNKTMQKGKRGGFRLILLLDNRTETCSCLLIYPKVGPQKKGNINDDEELKLLKSFKIEKEKKLLVEKNILV